MRSFLLCSVLCMSLAGVVSHAQVLTRSPSVSELPVEFIENHGQWDASVRAAQAGPSPHIFFGNSGWTAAGGQQNVKTNLETPQAPGLTVHFLKARTDPELNLRKPKEAISRYYQSADASEVIEARHYAQAEYSDLWPGVRVSLREEDGDIIQSVHLDAGVDASHVRMRITGADPTQLALQNSANGIQGRLHHLENGEMELRFRGVAPVSVTMSLSFVMQRGGAAYDIATDMIVDQNGDIILAGGTSSDDFPLLHPIFDSLGMGTSSFVMKCSRDGQQLRYSTYLPGSQINDIAAGTGNSCILIAKAFTLFPISDTTDSWLQRHERMVRLSAAGELLYSRCMPMEGLQELTDMDTDGNGYVYVLAHTYVTPPTVSPDAVFPVNQGSEDGYIMQFTPDIRSLCHATLLGGTSHEEFIALAVDREGRVAAMCNPISNTGTYPQVRPLQIGAGGGADLAITIFAAGLRSIEMSTWLGGSANEYSAGPGRSMAFDAVGNLYVALSSVSTDFPGGCSNSGGLDATVCSIRRDGTLSYATMIGAISHDFAMTLDVDDNGTVALLARNVQLSPGIPLLNPLQAWPPHPTGKYVSLLDSNGVLQYCSWFDGDISSPGAIVIDSASLLIAGSVYDSLQNSYDVELRGYDIQGTDAAPSSTRPRKGIPFMTLPELVLTTTDTVYYEKLRQYLTPDTIRISVVLRCPDNTIPTAASVLTLTLPAGMYVLPGQPDTTWIAASLLPGQETHRTWLCLWSPPRLPPADVEVTFAGQTQHLCPCTDSRFRQIAIKEFEEPPIEIDCALSFPELPKLTPGCSALANDTLVVHLKLNSRSAASLHFERILLVYDPSDGVALQDGEELERLDVTLAPGAEYNTEWRFIMQSWYYYRKAEFAVQLFDRYGLMTGGCADSVEIPGPRVMLCTAQVTSPVLWIAEEGRSDPDSIRSTLIVHNSLDSMWRCHSAMLDVSGMQYLQLTEPGMLYRPAFDVPSRGSASVSWTFAVAQPPDTIVSDHVRMLYYPQPERLLRSCEADIVLRPHKPSPACDIMMPDSVIVTENGGPVSFRVAVLLSNNGSVPLLLGGVRMEADSANGLRVMDTTMRAVAMIPPGGQESLYWDVQAVRVQPTTAAWLRVRMFNTAFEEVHRCEATTIVRGMGASLACTIDAADSLHFDTATGVYDPEHLLVRVLVRNLLDLPVEEGHVRFDTSGLSRLVLAPGSMFEITGITLPPRGSAEFTWVLHPRVDDQVSREHLFVMLRAKGDPEWSSCDHDVFLDAVNIDRRLECATAGHDTLWADPGYEKVIPVPLQLQYSLTNTGGTRLEHCAVAIVLPPVLRLAAAQDSVQEYGTIAPGATVRREWLCDVEESAFQPGGQTISWVTECDEFIPANHCNHTVTIKGAPPDGLVITPWLLRFYAEQDGPLPAEQSVTAWTGGGPGPLWTATPSPLWLNAHPLSSTGETEMAVQPNSTGLAPGTHDGAVTFSPVPLSTGSLQVVYTINKITAVDASPDAAQFRIHAMYPQPLSSGNTLVVEYSVGTEQAVSLQVYDLLGRLILEHHEHDVAPGLHRAVMSTGTMHPGVYLLILHGAGMTRSQAFLIVEQP